MSNVLLESASSGRPIISTNRSGCKEIIDHGKNGYLCNINDLDSLIKVVEKFINLTFEQKKEMGIFSRKKIIENYNRTKVINSYIEEINK